MTDNIGTDQKQSNELQINNNPKSDNKHNTNPDDIKELQLSDDSTKAQYDDDIEQDKINAFIEEDDIFDIDNQNNNNHNNLPINEEDIDANMQQNEWHIHPNNNNNNSNTNTNNKDSHNIFSYMAKVFKNKTNKLKKNKKSNNNENDMNDDNEYEIDNYDNNINDNNDITNNNNNMNNINSFNGYTDTMYAQQYNEYGQSIEHDKNEQEQDMTNLVGGDIPWNCEKCTFVNEPAELHCIMCFYSRFEVKNLPAQWQWKAADRWITYGIPETTEIETAYKSGAKEVSLSKGWFAQSPNLYRIYFDKEYGDKKIKKKHKKKNATDDTYHDFDANSTYFYQVNSDSGTRREVRRIASDDENLFQKLLLKDLDEKDRKCMICLNEFTVEEESEGIIVKLSTCKNHGFHKECIIQWVQLKGHCPLCRIAVDT